MFLNTRITNKKDTHSNFEKNNPLILNGEIIIVDHETDGIKLKICNGIDRYNSLPFLTSIYSEKPVYTYSEIEGLDEIISNLETKIQLIPVIPSGVIMIWSGLQTDIPDGYVLCNGENGTPDLTDKFIIGAGGTYNSGNTGGETSHTHKYNIGFRPYFGALAGEDKDAIMAYDYTTNSYNNASVIATEQPTRLNSGITNSYTTETPIFMSTEANVSTTSNMPPYYALCYIMKK